MSTKVLFGLCLVLSSITGIRAETIAAGATLSVRTNDTIDARDTGKGRVYSGVLDRDVFDDDNRLVIARGSDVELMVRDIGHHSVALDLDAVVVHGQRYSVVSYDVTRTGDEKDGVGANRRTGKFVGGGAFRERHISDVQLMLTKNANPKILFGEPWKHNGESEVLAASELTRGRLETGQQLTVGV